MSEPVSFDPPRPPELPRLDTQEARRDFVVERAKQRLFAEIRQRGMTWAELKGLIGEELGEIVPARSLADRLHQLEFHLEDNGS